MTALVFWLTALVDGASRGLIMFYMKRIDVRGPLGAAMALALLFVAGGALAQPEHLFEGLPPAAGLGVMLAAIFAVSALVGIVIMLLFALREIQKSGPRLR